MKILKKDLKNGEVKVRVETPEDLWHLGKILEPGDLVTTRTMRKIAVKHGGEFALSEKKPMVLTVELEKTSFDDVSGFLRVSGKITEGPETTRLSSYHTFQIEPGTELKITKGRWHSYQIHRMEESRVRQTVLLICVLDRDEADFAYLRESGISARGRIVCDDPENRERYHREIADFIDKQKGWEKLVVAGPGFEAENLLKYIKEHMPETASKAFLERSSSTGMNGINEVIKRSGDRMLKETRIARESRLVEEVLSRMKTDGLVAYGKDEVRKELEKGSVETLVVSAEKIRDFEDLMEAAERMGGKNSIVTADHLLGEQFLHLGGIAALLRFKTEY